MAVLQRVDRNELFGDDRAQPGGQDARLVVFAAQLAVVSLGLDLGAEEKDQVSARLEVGVQHPGFAGGELGNVAKKNAVVTAQIALH